MTAPNPPAEAVAALAEAYRKIGYLDDDDDALHDFGDFPGPLQRVTEHAAALRAALDAAGFAVVPKDGSLASEVAAEGLRAKALHGEPADRPGTDWLAILAEEFGEVAMEVTKGEVPPVNRTRAEYLTNLRGELVQVASVAMRWLAATDAAALSEADHDR